MKQVTNSILDAIKTNSECTSASIRWEDGRCVLKPNGYILAIDIRYRGSLRGRSTLPYGWYINEGNNQIIIYTIATTPLPQDSNGEVELFTYLGSFQILSCTIATSPTNVLQATLLNIALEQQTNVWGKFRKTDTDTFVTYSTAEVKWNEANKILKTKSSQFKGRNSIMHIIDNYQGSQLLDENGNEYNGPIVRSSRGKYFGGGDYAGKLFNKLREKRRITGNKASITQSRRY